MYLSVLLQGLVHREIGEWLVLAEPPEHKDPLRLRPALLRPRTGPDLPSGHLRERAQRSPGEQALIRHTRACDAGLDELTHLTVCPLSVASGSREPAWGIGGQLEPAQRVSAWSVEDPSAALQRESKIDPPNVCVGEPGEGRGKVPLVTQDEGATWIERKPHLERCLDAHVRCGASGPGLSEQDDGMIGGHEPGVGQPDDEPRPVTEQVFEQLAKCRERQPHACIFCWPHPEGAVVKLLYCPFGQFPIFGGELSPVKSPPQLDLRANTC